MLGACSAEVCCSHHEGPTPRDTKTDNCFRKGHLRDSVHFQNADRYGADAASFIKFKPCEGRFSNVQTNNFYLSKPRQEPKTSRGNRVKDKYWLDDLVCFGTTQPSLQVRRVNSHIHFNALSVPPKQL